MAAEIAVLTLDPPWSMILPGESMILRRWGSRSLWQHPTAWYNGKLLAPTDTYTYRIRMSVKALAPGTATVSPRLSLLW